MVTGQVKQYLKEQVACMMEELGPQWQDDPCVANQRAIEWIAANAARFRAEWFRRQRLIEPAGVSRTVRAS